jgi:RNA polymerase sigma-70 factor (sigma-E family)
VDEPEGFRDFVAARSAGLVRSAFLLTGDEHEALDLVQDTLVKSWSRWSRIRRQDAPDLYVRRVMVSLFLSRRRRRWIGEFPTASLPDQIDERDDMAQAVLRESVLAALRELPDRQRLVIVLRHFDDLTEAQTAQALGCSIGTVKSQNSKALASLRSSAGLASLFDEEVQT